MDNTVDNLIIEHLRAIRDQLSTLERKLDELSARTGSLEKSTLSIKRCMVQTMRMLYLRLSAMDR